jgi:hypothetical protein
MPRRNPPGRPKGTPKTGGRKAGTLNKATQEAKALAAAIVHQPDYLVQLAQRVNEGKAPHMETLLWHYAHGKPKEMLEVTGDQRLEITWKS